MNSKERRYAIEKKMQELNRQKEEQQRQALFERNRNLIAKFLEIAERKVSTLDEYGDENWEVLPVVIVACLKKIAQREGKKNDWREAHKLAREGASYYLSYPAYREYE